MADARNDQLRVLRELRRRGRSRGARVLADYFRLSRQAVGNTLNSLEEAGVVVKQKTSRADFWRIRPDVGYALAFSLGRSNLRAGLFNFDYEAVGDVKNYELAAPGSRWEADDVYNAIAQLSNELIDFAGIPPEKVVGLSASIPAPISRERYPRANSTRLASPWSLHTLASEERLPVERVLEALPDANPLREQLQGSESEEIEGDRGELVSLINDANAAALGLVMWMRIHRAQPPPRDLLYIYVGEGIGAGAIVGHRPLTGGMGLAGEIGHIAVDPQAEFCGRCGKRGCLEVVASGATMAKRIAAAVSQRKPDDPHTYIEILQSRGPQQRPHPVVPGVLRDCGWHLGTRIAAVCNVLNPTLVVIDSKDLVEIERARSQWDPQVEVGHGLRPTESVAYQGAVLHGLERHALGPIRRHLSPHSATSAATPALHDTSITGPTPERGVHFGTSSLGVDLPAGVSLPLLGAAADVFDGFADRYLAGSVLNPR